MKEDYEKITADDYDKRVLEKPFESYKEEYYNEPIQFNKLKRTLKEIPVEGKKVLELGCSMGFFSFEFAKAGAEVTAVDYSFHSLQIAHQFLKEQRNKNLKVSFYQMDARKLTFPPESFHVIVNYDFIEHIYPRDQKQVIKEMHRVLKRGGVIVTYTPNYNRVRMEYYIQKIIRGLNGKKWGWQHSESGEEHQDTVLHVGLLSLNELITLFERNGFTLLFSDNEEYSFPGVRWLNQFKILPNLFNANSFIFCKKQGNKNKILYISHTDKLSGGEKSVFQYIQQLDHEKYEPILLCPAPGMLSQFAQEHKVPVVFHTLRLFSKRKPWQYFIDLFWLIQFLKKERIQIMHGMNFYTAQLAGVASRLTSIPLIVHGQNIFSNEEAKKEVKRNCLRYCQKILVCSEAVAEPLWPLLPKDKIVVLYHSVLLPDILPKKTYFLHKKFGLSKKTKLVGHIGLLEERKCQDVLIHATKDVLQKHKNVAFLLIGDALFGTTAYKEMLQRLVHELGLEKTVYFLGFRNDIPTIIPELDIVTLPSYNEPLAMATLEACSYARPYVGAYTGGTSEILRDKENALLVPPKDKEKLADALCYFLEHPKEAKAIGEKARETMREYCDVKKNSVKLFEIYESLLQTH